MTINRLNQQWLYRLLILLVILSATWLRWWQLDQIPPGLWFDEAYNGMDALWMLETGSMPLFLEGNNGREPMYHYLTALAIGGLGSTPYAMRLVSTMVGIITVALLYRAGKNIFSRNSPRYWLALFSAAGLAFSYWHLTVSRTAFRTILVPPFVILTIYFFWMGFQRRSFTYFALAGVALGVGQYSYLSFRLFPLVLVLLMGGHTLFGKTTAESSPNRPVSRRRLWLGLLLTAAIALTLVLPVGVYFVTNADKLLERSTQVSIWSEIATGKITLAEHLRQAVSVFGTGADPNWRHDLPSHTAFAWPMITGFWLGVLISLRRFRHPQYLLLVVGTVVMWLPGLLSTPAAHALRLTGLLPFYYLLAGLGMVESLKFVGQKISPRPSLVPALNLAAFAIIILWNGGSTAYDYFWRWANHIEVYQEYKGNLKELTDYIIKQSEQTDILIPFPAYNYPPTRFLLHDTFREMAAAFPPPSARPLLLVDPSLGRSNWGNSPSYVWLTRDQSGQGAAYVSLQDIEPVLPEAATTTTSSFHSPTRGLQIASLTPVEDVEAVQAVFFSQPPFTPVNYNWLQKFQLVGYQLVPHPVLPGQTLDINLYWRAIERVPDWDYTVVVEIYSGQGRFVSRSEFSTEKLLHWRAAGVEIGARRLFYIGPDLPPGPYLLRLKIQWGQAIVPATTPDGEEVSETVLGIFYVADETGDPRLPPIPLNVTVGDQFELTGFAPPAPLGNNLFRGKLYWRANQQVPRDFSPFVYLVDGQDQIISRGKAGRLAGQYPTSHWQPGETVVDEYDISLPEGLAAGQYRLVTGIADPETGSRLPVIGAQTGPLPDNLIKLTEFSVP